MIKKPSKLRLLALPSALLFIASTTVANEHHHHYEHQHHHSSSAPVGIMGDHIHEAGRWMVSFKHMNMLMSGSRIDSDRVDDDAILSTPNRFAPPANLRVTPVNMRTKMNMLGIMYGISDNVTSFAMFNYLEKTMDHQTYQGMMGNTELGQFTVENKGIGDTKVGLLYQADDIALPLIWKLGVSIPTGSIDEEAEVLTPMNTRPVLRSPYAMQLGSGTYDLEPAVTLSRVQATGNQGIQFSSVLRVEDNDNNYRLGNQYVLNTWSTMKISSDVSISARLTAQYQEAISGEDDKIKAPIQTANPDFYERKDALLSLGSTWNIGTSGFRFAGEFTKPIYQDVEGVQMNRKHMVTVALTKSF